jgi:hypothetical protein
MIYQMVKASANIFKEDIIKVIGKKIKEADKEF